LDTPTALTTRSTQGLSIGGATAPRRRTSASGSFATRASGNAANFTAAELERLREGGGGLLMGVRAFPLAAQARTIRRMPECQSGRLNADVEALPTWEVRRRGLQVGRDGIGG
jgi:hypothetical protein